MDEGKVSRQVVTKRNKPDSKLQTHVSQTMMDGKERRLAGLGEMNQEGNLPILGCRYTPPKYGEVEQSTAMRGSRDIYPSPGFNQGHPQVTQRIFHTPSEHYYSTNELSGGSCKDDNNEFSQEEDRFQYCGHQQMMFTRQIPSCEQAAVSVAPRLVEGKKQKFFLHKSSASSTETSPQDTKHLNRSSISSGERKAATLCSVSTCNKKGKYFSERSCVVCSFKPYL